MVCGGTDQGEQSQCKKQASASEAEAGKPITGDRAGQRLHQRTGQGDRQRLADRLRIVDHLQHITNIFQCKRLRNPYNRRIEEFRRFPEGNTKHIQQGIDNDKGQPENEEKPQHRPYNGAATPDGNLHLALGCLCAHRPGQGLLPVEGKLRTPHNIPSCSESGTPRR